MENERHAGGLWCHEVLALLADYVDGELDAKQTAAVEAHLESCDLCERFGGQYREAVRSIRALLLPDSEHDESPALVRLKSRLRAELASAGR